MCLLFYYHFTTSTDISTEFGKSLRQTDNVVKEMASTTIDIYAEPAQAEQSDSLVKAKEYSSHAVGCLKDPIKTLDRDNSTLRSPTIADDINLSELAAFIQRLQGHIANPDKKQPLEKDETPLPEYSTAIVDTVEGISRLVDTIILHHPSCSDNLLFIDSEGVNLGRDGTISLLQIYIPEVATVYLIDIFILGGVAFTITGADSSSHNLKTTLESRGLWKVIWDCRADSDALLAIHDVRLQAEGIVDVQLFEWATQKTLRTAVKSLEFAVQRRINLQPRDREMWLAAKQTGKKIMNDGLGGLEKGRNREKDANQDTETSPSKINSCAGEGDDGKA